jgi:hypothetical protein
VLVKGKARKFFFSEEKKQKTFIIRPWPGYIRAMAGERKFFGSFFQKRPSLSLCFSNVARPASKIQRISGRALPAAVRQACG